MKNDETIAREAVERASIAPVDVSRETAPTASKRRSRTKNEKPRAAIDGVELNDAIAAVGAIDPHAAERGADLSAADDFPSAADGVSRETSPLVDARAFVSRETVAVDARDAQAVATSPRDTAAHDDVSRETSAPLPGAIVVAVVNQKGGVGKTTTAVNLAASLAHIGHRVLVVDGDPQGNASTGFGVDKATLDCDLFDVLIDGRSADEAIVRTSIAGLDIIPATMQLAGAELLLAERAEREYHLRTALQNVSVWYDYVLIDCPPSLSLLTINALVAATAVIVPVQAEFYSLEGLAQLVAILERVRGGLNPELELLGLVVTMFDGRTRLALDVLAELEAGFASRVFGTRIPRTIRLSEAPSFGKPILTFDPKSRGSEAYLELAREFHARIAARAA